MIINALIETIFSNFTVNDEKIPVKYMRYEGHGEPYITYQQMDADNSFSGDDDLLGYVVYYDFDIYSMGNFKEIVESVKELLKANGFIWQPSRSRADQYEDDTKYYHKTLNFAFLIEEIEED